MSYEAFTRPPRSNSWRLISGALLCLIEFTIFFPMAAATGTVNGIPSPFGWPLGLWLWAVSLVLVICYIAAARGIKRAVVFYVLEHMAAGLGMVELLVLGLSMLDHLVGRAAFLMIGGGVLVGWATMVAKVPARRAWFKAAMERGHLAKSLDVVQASWNTRYDFDQGAAELRAFENRGCLTRMLPWIGPAIGMSLADVVGRWSTMVLVALILLAMGYWLVGLGTVHAVARHLELRRLEGVLGRPILLAEDDNPRKQ